MNKPLFFLIFNNCGKLKLRKKINIYNILNIYIQFSFFPKVQEQQDSKNQKDKRPIIFLYETHLYLVDIYDALIWNVLQRLPCKIHIYDERNIEVFDY